eukprot:2061737-Rhodomonas_salina.1
MVRQVYAVNKKQYIDCTVLEPADCRGDTIMLPGPSPNWCLHRNRLRQVYLRTTFGGCESYSRSTSEIPGFCRTSDSHTQSRKL